MHTGAFLTTNANWGPSTVPSFQDMRQLAAGSLVLCMLGSMGQICPPARILSLLRAKEPAAAAGIDLAAAASGNELALQPPQGNAAAGTVGGAAADSQSGELFSLPFILAPGSCICALRGHICYMARCGCWLWQTLTGV